MMEENDPVGTEGGEGVTVKPEESTPGLSFPNEPFPCPACGQMLAPSCRVCVACKHTIDPAELCKPPATVSPTETKVTAQAPVRFPWRVFFLVLAIWMIGASAAQHFLGPLKSQLVLGGVQIVTSVWVFYDALSQGLPKPLRWGVGSLLLWPLIFPWYLVRRAQPFSPCPFVETPASPMARTVLLVLLLVFFVLILRGGISA